MVERAYPQAVRSAARRAWQVNIDPDPRRLACTTPGCPAAVGVSAHGQAAQQAALNHLAAHAQHEALDEHLRTCRCHAHGCTWHPRHRGCTGPIQLTVFRRQRGRSWHLADTCTGCAHLIPHAAPVSGPAPERSPSPVTGCARRTRNPGRRSTPPPDPATRIVLPALLQYLAAALPRVPSAAKILALCCLLRADAHGAVHLPLGLLRALRLDHQREQLVVSLAEGHWLRLEERGPDPQMWRQPGTLAVQIADSAATGALAGLSGRERRSLADAAVRLLTQPQLRAVEDCVRLAALHQLGTLRCDSESGHAGPVPAGHPHQPGTPPGMGTAASGPVAIASTLSPRPRTEALVTFLVPPH